MMKVSGRAIQWDDADYVSPRSLITVLTSSGDKLICGSHLMPGWGCGQCHVYNNIGRPTCKQCGYMPSFNQADVDGFELEIKKAGGRT